MTEIKRKAGRPRLEASLFMQGAPSRRQALNAMYMFEAVHCLTEAYEEIPDLEILWYTDDETKTARGKNGILEQIGRMLIQDHFSEGDCVYIANLAIGACKAGYKSRTVETAIRNIRMTTKQLDHDPENPRLLYEADAAVRSLVAMRQREE